MNVKRFFTEIFRITGEILGASDNPHLRELFLDLLLAHETLMTENLLARRVKKDHRQDDLNLIITNAPCQDNLSGSFIEGFSQTALEIVRKS